MLTRDEVAAVMAHELAHVKNRDTLVMTMTATIAGAISMLANFGLLFRGSDSRGNILAMLLAVIVAPFAAMLVQLAISRTREYGADSGGAAMHGNPRALASALAKLARGARGGAEPVRRAQPGRRLALHRPRPRPRRQLVLDPSGDREPDRTAGGDGRRDGPSFAAAGPRGGAAVRRRAEEPPRRERPRSARAAGLNRADPPGTASRRAALRLLDAVLRKGLPLESALDAAARDLERPDDRAFAHAIAAEALRRLPDLDALIDRATKQRLPDDAKARFALRIALVQALALGTPHHAAISTVLPLVDGGPRRLVHGVFSAVMREKWTLPEVPTLAGAGRRALAQGLGRGGGGGGRAADRDAAADRPVAASRPPTWRASA